MMMMQSIVTVTTAATSYDLTTLSDVKAELSIANDSSDAILSRYISSASAAVAQYCNRVFPLETVSESFIPNRSDRFFRFGVTPLQLTRWPLTAISSVTEDATALVAGTDYVIDYPTAKLTRLTDNGFPKSWLNATIVVSYSAGYATIPVDVQDAVIRMVTARYASKGRDRNLKQQSIPGVIEQSWWISTGTDSGNMTPDVTDILDNYRVPLST